jgi:hypothetical protein
LQEVTEAELRVFPLPLSTSLNLRIMLSQPFELLQIAISRIVQLVVQLCLYSVSPLRPEPCLKGFPVSSAVEAARAYFAVNIEVLAYIWQRSQTHFSEIFGTTLDIQVLR